MRFRNAVAINLLSQAVGLFCNVAVVLLLSRWLGAEQRGIHAIAVTTFQLGVIAFSFGASGAVASYLANDNTRLPYLRSILFKILLSVVVGFCVLGALIDAGLIIISLTGLGLVIILNGIACYLKDVTFALCMAQGRFYLGAVVATVGPCIVLLCVLIAGQNLISVAAALYIQAAAFFVGAILGIPPLISANKDTDVLPRSGIDRFWWKVSLLGYISSLLTLAMLRADLYIVDANFGSRIAGVYALAQALAELVLKLPTWAAMVLTNYVAANRNHSIAKTIVIAKYASVIAFASSSILLVLQDQISLAINFLVGKDFAEASNLFLLMQPRIVIQSAIAIIAAHLAGQGYTIWHPLHALVGLLSVLTLCILAISENSVAYIAIASSLAYLCAALVIWIGFTQYNNLDFYGKANALIKNSGKA